MSDDPFLTPSFRYSNLAAPQVREQSASVIQIDSTKVAISWLLSGLALGGVLMVALIAPSLVKSGVDAGVSESRAYTAQELATAKADMDAANTNARLALDRADKMAAALEARGLIKLENH